MKKRVKINFVDFYRGFDKENNDFTQILREKYDVVISDNPDYLFYSTFGREYLKYDCVRICYTGECVVPDFNLCDYAMAFEKMQYGDRYLRIPLYELFQYRKRFLQIIASNIQKCKKTAFCGFVVSNDQGMKERSEIVEILNRYKKVDSGGRYMNNVGGPVKDKFAFDQQHKFSICFENSSHPGYTTEKIVEAFAADTIPIYLGDPDIGEVFNTKAFINVADYSSLEEAAQKIIEIDQNEEMYKAMKSEPILSCKNDHYNDLKHFLYSIVEQPIEIARRRPTNTRMLEKEEEQRIYNVYLNCFGRYKNRVKAFVRRLKNHAL